MNFAFFDRETTDISPAFDAAYVCGFVCGHAGEYMDDEMKTPASETIKTLKRSPAILEQLTLRDLRRIVHFIMRSEL